jgi:predicted phosphodiesterase
MRVALISDIHGTCFALDTVLTELRSQSVDQIICLGDAIQGGPQPAETVQRLREVGWSARPSGARENAETGLPQALQAAGPPIVMGNADAFLLGEEKGATEPISEQLRDVRAWAVSQLSMDDQSFIRSFQPTIEIPLEDGHRLLCFHGSPTSYNDILLPETPGEDWQRLLGPYAPAIMTGGHTHTQQMRRIGVDAPGKGAGFFFNPGSVGFVYDVTLPQDQVQMHAWAEYAILTTEQGHLSLDFRRVPYDLDHLLDIYRASGRPHAESRIAEYQRATS